MLRYLYLILLCSTALCVNSQNDPLRIELRRMIGHDTSIEHEDTPGFLVGILDRDTSFIVDFGFADQDGDQTLTDTSTFELGSLTKVMTASIVLQLAEDKILALDSSANYYLPKSYHNPRMQHLTVRDLLQHTTGLPKRPSQFGIKNKKPQNPYRYYTKTDLLHFYDEYVPSKAKKQEYSYSHVNYALLEVIIEQVTGDNYEMVANRLLWDPLDMRRTYIALPENTATITMGYDHAGRETSPWTFSSFAGSEGVKSTMQDLIKYMHVHLDPNTDLHRLMEPHLDSEIRTNLGKNAYSSMGWQLLKSRKTPTIIMHSGMTSGHHCYIAAVPSTRTAVVILSNSVIGTQDLCLLALRMINYNWERKT